MHPSFEQWVEYHEGQLPEPKRAELEAHLDSGCSACRAMETDVKRLVAALTGDRLLDPSAAAVRAAVRKLAADTEAARRSNPFGVPYEPYIWGAGWNIQDFGVRQYFLHAAFPDLVDREGVLSALYENPVYKALLEVSGNRQEVMLGYSDSC